MRLHFESRETTVLHQLIKHAHLFFFYMLDRCVYTYMVTQSGRLEGTFKVKTDQIKIKSKDHNCIII